MPQPDTSASPAADNKKPDAIRQGLMTLAAATDTQPPGDGMSLHPVNLSQPISVIARCVGMVLHAAPIFRYGQNLSTVDNSGQITAMNPERFTTWVEGWLTFIDGSSVKSIGKDMAGKILAADQFRDQLRELKAVSEVRLPVWTGDGESRTVELSPEGFDAGTGLFTVNRIPYRDDMTEEEGRAVFWKCLKDFPFDPEGEVKVERRRSFSAQMAAMIGVYCHALFAEGTPRPMIVFNANQPGSGKSLLMRLALSPVHGQIPESDKPDDEKALQTLLESAALQRDPFLVLDNCYNLRSKGLDRFISSPVHSPRLFNKQETRAVKNVTQVFANGNSLLLTKDLDRRALVIDLSIPGEAADRTFEWEITEEWYPLPEVRAQFLAALWSLVRTWRDAGMPRMKEHRRASFETWSRLIGGIVISCGLANPFAPRTAENGGDESGRALRLVLGLLAGEAMGGCEIILKTGDIIARATAAEVLELIVPPDKNPEKSLGWAIKALGLPRHLVDSQGRAFEFRKRDLANGAGYVVRFL